MRRFLFSVFCFLFFVTLFLFLPSPFSLRPSALVFADQLDDLNNQIQEYEQKINDLAGQKKTLASTINYLNTQIQLTQSKIAKTEQELIVLADEIDILGTQIDSLNTSLDELSKIFRHRIRKTYKQTDIEPLYLFFTSRGFNDFVNQLKYVNTVQEHDRDIMLNMERTRLNYDLQKDQKEQAQAKAEALRTQLTKQKTSLAQQQQDKKQLLESTQNDERKYQDLLSKARAELNAIQNIIAGKGEETKVGDISEGSKIATVISGASACSSGSHLHFEVVQNGANFNPFNYLSNKSVIWDNADPQPSFTGSWNWPVNDTVRVTQGYGRTSYSAIYANGFHTGVDMVNSDKNYDVKTVRNGILYRGSIACGGGTLRYVKVDQGDGLSTYYLHVNY